VEWQTVLDLADEGPAVVLVTRRGDRFEVLGLFLDPCGTPVVKVEGLPAGAGGALPSGSFAARLLTAKGMLQAARASTPSRFDMLELDAGPGRRRSLRGTVFRFRCYNTEPQAGPAYVLYDVPGLDVAGLRAEAEAW
jgi:hypothetical protein